METRTNRRVPDELDEDDLLEGVYFDVYASLDICVQCEFVVSMCLVGLIYQTTFPRTKYKHARGIALSNCRIGRTRG